MNTVNLTRADGRATNQLRELKFTLDWVENPTGSCLVEFGKTRVLCTVSILNRIPRWLKGAGQGWLTAEYQMIPGSSSERIEREAVRGKISGRTHEISRLIGRSLRAIIDLKTMSEVTIAIDCEVLQADGGTRTASISGSYCALMVAIEKAKLLNLIPESVELLDSISAVSVGIVDGVPMLDLNYAEDSRAETDMNIVQLGNGNFVELQGTAEAGSFDNAELVELIKLGTLGCSEIQTAQKSALAGGK
ncbi:MAG: ribonuclease PH [Bifidobacteriaceae bacterium]|jgi:ribonuclease PH|nr:ribonuclease PH [Bifidobacteriaceae bacterium]